MKQYFLLCILLACFKLSVVAQKTDTLKKTHSDTSSDTFKKFPSVKNDNDAHTNQDSIQIALAHRFIDSIKTVSSSRLRDSLKLMASITIEKPARRTKKTVEIFEDAPEISAPVANYTNNFKTLSSLIQLDSLRSSILMEEARQAMIRRIILRNEQIKIQGLLKINNLDSLKQELKVTGIDTLKALLYSRIALKYLDYDTISNKDKKYFYQNQALSYTLQALHEYSSYNDSIGLRSSYDNLAKIYNDQKKYTQAKWFILQSNTLSRYKNDVPNIITSLLTLATIKGEIKDYQLAMGDLNEALQLSITHHTPKTELDVLKNYALLYNQLKDHAKEAMILKKRDSLLDSMRKSDEALLAKAALQKKKLELQQNKKKLLTLNTRKLSKNNSQAKMASL